METLKNANTDTIDQATITLTPKDIRQLTLSAEEKKALRNFVIDFMESNPIGEPVEEEVKE